MLTVKVIKDNVTLIKQGTVVHCERINPKSITNIPDWISQHLDIQTWMDCDITKPEGEIIRVCISNGEGNVLHNLFLSTLGVKLYVMNDQGATIESMTVCPID